MTVREIPDIRFTNLGTIWLVRAPTHFGQAWLDEHVAFETFFGGAGVVEHRYVHDIIEGALMDMNVEVV